MNKVNWKSFLSGGAGAGLMWVAAVAFNLGGTAQSYESKMQAYDYRLGKLEERQKYLEQELVAELRDVGTRLNALREIQSDMLASMKEEFARQAIFHRGQYANGKGGR